MRFILLLLLTVSSLAFGQRSQTIDADCLRIKDGICVDKTELGYLDGLTGNIKDDLDLKADAASFQSQIDDRASIDGDQTLSGIKTINGAIKIVSTDYTSTPCPVMTEAQRDLLVTVANGDCIYNSTSASLNIYNGTIWKTAGGGLSNWETSFSYAINDIVIESNKIYQCLTAHTSGAFATDLAATKWLRVSTDVAGATGVLPTANGGSGANITPVLGSVVATNGSTMELVAAGNAGEVLQSNGTSTPSFVPKSISAKAENGSSVTLEEIQVPNNQFTTTATNKHLLNDCGSSNNLLANCGFEHSTPATSWTLTNGSSAVETSNVKQGKQALKLTLSAQSLDFYQISTLNATAFADGVNGSISLAIKTTVDNVYLCRTDSAGAVVASTDGTKITNCVKISNSGKWGDYVLPVILGATSNGLRLVSLTPSTAAAVAVTGDVYVDAGILEAGLKATSQGVCTTDSCETEFSAYVSSTGVVTQENTDWINGNFVVSGTSVYTGTLKTGLVTLSLNCTAIIDGNSRIVRGAVMSSSQVQFVTTDLTPALQANPFYVTCQKQGVDFTNAKALANGRIYTAQSADTDWFSCGHTTSDFTGFGTVTSIETQCKRDRGDLLMKGKFTSGTSTAVEGRVNLKLNGVALTSKSSTTIPTIQLAGQGNYSGTAAGMTYSVLIEPSVAYNTFGVNTGGLSATSKANGNSMLSSGQVFTFISRVPINGWENSNVIIGSFAEVNTSPGIAKPKTCHYAFGGASATLASPTECTTGTCVEVLDSCGTGTPPAWSSAAVYANFTFAAGTFANSSYIKCECTSYDVTAGFVRNCMPWFDTGDQTWATTSNGGMVLNLYSTTPAGVENTGYVSLTCKGSAP